MYQKELQRLRLINEKHSLHNHSLLFLSFFMTTYNTGSDSANTSVRAFLTKIGEFYLGKSFNTSSGKGKQDWTRIKEEIFESQCAYCGCVQDKPTIEHLVMFNRTECGLHHPGNIVPCCKKCNKRERDKDGNYLSWEEHLLSICENIETYKKRKQKILNHIKAENYPNLTEDEKNALKAICEHLYSSTKSELDKSLVLYKNIDQTLVNKR